MNVNKIETSRKISFEGFGRKTDEKLFAAQELKDVYVKPKSSTEKVSNVSFQGFMSFVNQVLSSGEVDHVFSRESKKGTIKKYYLKGKKFVKVITTYPGGLEKVKHFDAEGKLKLVERINVDGSKFIENYVDGKKVKDRILNASGDKILSTIYKWVDGKLVSSISTDREARIFTEYDSQGKEIRRTLLSVPKVRRRN